MRLQFSDQTFSFKLLRAASYALYDGAEIGECLATAARIKESDFPDYTSVQSPAVCQELCKITGAGVSAGKGIVSLWNFSPRTTA